MLRERAYWVEFIQRRHPYLEYLSGCGRGRVVKILLVVWKLNTIACLCTTRLVPLHGAINHVSV